MGIPCRQHSLEAFYNFEPTPASHLSFNAQALRSPDAIVRFGSFCDMSGRRADVRKGVGSGH